MLTRVLLLLLILSVTVRAQSSFEHAQRAQALLGPEVWSQLIVVRNDSRDTVYPRTVHALVFELAGILWFYTDTNGTQSFSLRRGELEREKADFAPLLRDIDPGFRAWAPAGPAKKRRAPSGPEAALKNGCFIESIVALRERLARGEAVGNPRLLSFYAPTAAGMIGHTVLAYETGDRVEIFDPALPKRAAAFPRSLSTDALTLARALEGGNITKARYLVLRPEPLLGAIAQHLDASPRPGALAGRTLE